MFDTVSLLGQSVCAMLEKEFNIANDLDNKSLIQRDFTQNLFASIKEQSTELNQASEQITNLESSMQEINQKVSTIITQSEEIKTDAALLWWLMR